MALIHETHEKASIDALSDMCFNREIYRRKALAMSFLTYAQSMTCTARLSCNLRCRKRVEVALIHETDEKASIDALADMCFNREIYRRKALAMGFLTYAQSMTCMYR